ncbi:MAG: hydroxyisourate hydrolase [Bacteriovorax sp. MedPE-SWde]|nr:MAG: hydroxyisourate hydrolase [Bacteriovorax sp. MedPE-SWde]
MISTHILDTHLGNPASGVEVKLQKQTGDTWTDIGVDRTNDDGRIVYDCAYEAGVYRLDFEIEEYYAKNKQEFFFVTVPIIFNITDTNRKYHVPLLLNPFGYTTYRGS